MTLLRFDITGPYSARCGEVEAKGRGMAGPLGPLARKLLDAGAARPFDSVEVYAPTGTISFPARALIHWAASHTSEGEQTSARTGVYKPRPQLEAAE